LPLSFYFLIPILFCVSWSDWKARRIPNMLLFPAFGLALLTNLLSMGVHGLWITLSGTVMGFFLLIIPFLLDGIGAGDVKLLMVIGSFGGINLVLTGFIVGAIFGGIVSIVLLLYRKIRGKKIAAIPYGIPLSLGTVVCILL